MRKFISPREMFERFFNGRNHPPNIIVRRPAESIYIPRPGKPKHWADTPHIGPCGDNFWVLPKQVDQMLGATEIAASPTRPRTKCWHIFYINLVTMKIFENPCKAYHKYQLSLHFRTKCVNWLSGMPFVLRFHVPMHSFLSLSFLQYLDIVTNMVSW